MRGEGSGAVGRKWSNWGNDGIPESQDSDYKHMYIDLRYRRLSGTRRIAEEKGPSQTEQHQMSRKRTTIKTKNQKPKTKNQKPKTKKLKNQKKKKKSKSVQSERGEWKEGCMCVCACVYVRVCVSGGLRAWRPGRGLQGAKAAPELALSSPAYSTGLKVCGLGRKTCTFHTNIKEEINKQIRSRKSLFNLIFQDSMICVDFIGEVCARSMPPE